MLKAHTAQFGAVSSGTMRPYDLIDAFADTLDYLLGDDKTDEEKQLFVDINALKGDDSDNVDDADGILQDLFDRLNELAPAYGYFGASEGDGADYGFWLPSDFEYCFEGIKVNDLGDVPQGYGGDVLEVNDHGNMTLYYADGNDHLEEIWSVC